MNDFLIGFMMFICMVPTALVLHFMIYPKDWKSKKRIFGVNNRSEFQGEKESEFIDLVFATHKKQGLVILIAILVISVLLLFVPSLNLKMTLWSVFVIVALIVIMIPYALGNSEIKKYKNNLGIISDTTLYADLKNAGAIHVLNKGILTVSALAGVIIFMIALLADLKVLKFAFLERSFLSGSFIYTGITGSFLFITALFVFIGLIVDNSRNEVVSENSDVNANYNRSRKKLFANLTYLMIWADNAVGLLTIVLSLALRSEITMFVFFLVYMIFIMAAMAVYGVNKYKLDDRYQSENVKMNVDDDDYWVLGMFYFNPNDKRLNVDKRVGIGYTINMAHPVGMIIAAFGVLSIAGSFLVILWILMMGKTPINVYEEGNVIICHHLWDEYKIKESEITEIFYGEDISELKMARTAGTGLENVLKGTFKVNEDSGCKLFLNPKSGDYIRIVTNDKIYYISGNSVEETQSLFADIKE